MIDPYHSKLSIVLAYQWWIQDFPEGEGCLPQRWGERTYYSVKFVQKLHENIENVDAPKSTNAIASLCEPGLSKAFLVPISSAWGLSHDLTLMSHDLTFPLHDIICHVLQ